MATRLIFCTTAQHALLKQQGSMSFPRFGTPLLHQAAKCMQMACMWRRLPSSHALSCFGRRTGGLSPVNFDQTRHSRNYSLWQRKSHLSCTLWRQKYMAQWLGAVVRPHYQRTSKPSDPSTPRKITRWLDSGSALEPCTGSRQQSSVDKDWQHLDSVFIPRPCVATGTCVKLISLPMQLILPRHSISQDTRRRYTLRDRSTKPKST